MKKYAVIGLGLLGRTVARELSQRGVEVVAIDVDGDLVQSIADDVAYAVRLDSTNRDALVAQGVDKVDAALVAIGKNFQAAVLTTALLKEMNIPRVISRAVTEEEARILRLVNADQVVLVEEWVAKRLAQRMLSPSLMDIVELAPGMSLARVRTIESMWGKTLASLKFRQQYGLNVVAVIRTLEGQVEATETLLPDPDATIAEGDVLLVEGPDDAIERLTSDETE